MFNDPGLYVADASVIPTNLGVNPSLTITAMTERAMSRIPRQADAPPIQPFECPAGVTMEAETSNGSRLKLALPFLMVLLPLIVLWMLLKAISRKS